MPGRKSYGPGGKWIYQRAARLRAENPDMKESTSFAVATQQAHKVGKSPKGFRTPQGVREAKSKMTGPIKEYRKTAASQEWNDIYRAGLAGNEKFLKMRQGLSQSEKRRYGRAVLKQMKALPMRQPGPGEKAIPQIHDYRKWSPMTPEEAGIRKLAGFFDEMDKIASLGAVARLGAGLLLGSMLWSALGKDEKREMTRASKNLGDAPAILPMTEEQQQVVEKELRKPDPDFRGVMGDILKRPEVLEREQRIRGIRQRWGSTPVAVTE